MLEKGAELDEHHLETLRLAEVTEIVVDDPRVADVSVAPLVAPELEAEAAQALRELLKRFERTKALESTLLGDVERPVLSIVRDLFPDDIREVNAFGCDSVQDYAIARPTRVVGLSLLMGKRLGYGPRQLVRLGMAALLMDIGLALLPAALGQGTCLTASEQQIYRTHPRLGAQHLHNCDIGAIGIEVVEAVLHHEERWDGSGHPQSLRGEQIPRFARIIAIADAYYELVSKRPRREPLLPHEAVEYIMAYSGRSFDPGLVELFCREMPLYPTGVTVRLNMGEIGIVSDANVGDIGRPVIRICTDRRGSPISEPFDLDLSMPENRTVLVSQVMDF